MRTPDSDSISLPAAEAAPTRGGAEEGTLSAAGRAAGAPLSGGSPPLPSEGAGCTPASPEASSHQPPKAVGLYRCRHCAALLWNPYMNYLGQRPVHVGCGSFGTSSCDPISVLVDMTGK